VHPINFIEAISQTGWVSESLFRANLGGGTTDLVAADLYLSLPPKSRPRISYFFDATFYNESNPDVATSVEVDPFIHFLEYGYAEGRCPHPLIDIRYIRECDAYILPENGGPNEIYDLLCYNLMDPSPYFSCDFYRKQLSEVSSDAGGLLEHFLRD